MCSLSYPIFSQQNNNNIALLLRAEKNFTNVLFVHIFCDDQSKWALSHSHGHPPHTHTPTPTQGKCLLFLMRTEATNNDPPLCEAGCHLFFCQYFYYNSKSLLLLHGFFVELVNNLVCQFLKTMAVPHCFCAHTLLSLLNLPLIFCQDFYYNSKPILLLYWYTFKLANNLICYFLCDIFNMTTVFCYFYTHTL